MQFMISLLRKAEPLLFISFFMVSVEIITLKSLIYEKTCSEIYSDCSFLRSKNLTDNLTISKRSHVQQETSNFFSIYGFLSTLIPFLLVLYFGLLVDKGKFIQSWVLSMSMFLVGILGFITVFKLNLNTRYFYLFCVLKSCFGGNTVFTMTSFSYVAKTASPGTLSWRILLADTFTSLGYILGTFLGGFLTQTQNYDLCFIIISVLCLFCVVYPILFISNLRVPETENESFKSKLLSIVSLFSPRKYNRLVIIGHLILYLVVYFTFQGYYTISYLYLSGDPFLMTNVQYSVITAVIGACSLLFGLFGVFLLKKNFLSVRILAALVGVIGCGGYMISGLANTNLLIYIGAVLYSVSSLNIANCKTLLISLVDEKENGRLIALIFVLKGFLLLALSPTVMAIYSVSLNFYTGLVFIIHSVTSLITGVAFLFTEKSKRSLSILSGRSAVNSGISR